MANAAAQEAKFNVQEYARGLKAWIDLRIQKDPKAFEDAVKSMTKEEFVESAMHGYANFTQEVLADLKAGRLIVQ